VLGLPIPALVLVSQGAGNLEVALEAGDHQELLELLRRLGKRVELARIKSGRDQVVAGPFGVEAVRAASLSPESPARRESRACVLRPCGGR
jgi:hypothetical protein